MYQKHWDARTLEKSFCQSVYSGDTALFLIDPSVKNQTVSDLMMSCSLTQRMSIVYMKCLIAFDVERGAFSRCDPNNLPNVFASPCVDIMCWQWDLWGLIHCSFVVVCGCCTLGSQFFFFFSATEWISTIFWIGWGIKSVIRLMMLRRVEQIWPCQIINTWACFLKFKLLLKRWRVVKLPGVN